MNSFKIAQVAKFCQIWSHRTELSFLFKNMNKPVPVIILFIAAAICMEAPERVRVAVCPFTCVRVPML